MFKYIGILAMVFVMFSGCTKKSNPICIVKEAVVSVGVVAISQKLQCLNQDAIKKTLSDASDKVLKMCAPGAESIGGDICSQLSKVLLASLINGAVPPEWSCSAADASAQLGDVLDKACIKAFP